MVLVLWGFDSDEARRSKFQLSKVVEDKIAEPETAPSVSTPTRTVETPPVVPSTTHPQVETQEPIAPPPPPVPPTINARRFNFKWWWLLLLLLLAALAYYFWQRSDDDNVSVHLPEPPGVLPPIDTANFYHDSDDSLRPTILGNRLNIFLKKGQNINKFADNFKTKYPDPSVKFVFYDTLYNMLQLEFPISERDKWRKNLEGLPEIATVLDEKIFENQRQPSDPDFSAGDKRWYFDVIGAFAAWDVTQGSPSVKVCVIDDGFDPNHVEYKDKIDAAARNVVANNKSLNPIYERHRGGVSPHGTHVSATAVGKADNGNGVSGIAPNCGLLPLQVGLPNGSMSTMGIIMAIQYAVLKGVSVINLSLGGSIDPMVELRIASLPVNQQQQLVGQIARTRRYQEEQAVFNQIFGEANRQNVVIVKAAGNSNILMDFDAMATTPYTINVAAIGPDRRRASFSSFGANTVCAPGVHIYNAAPGNTYAFLDGTSMASPIVTGAVALIRSQNPNLTPAQVKDLLVRTGDPVLLPDRPLGPIIRLDKALGSAGNVPKDPCQDKVERRLAHAVIDDIDATAAGECARCVSEIFA